VISFTRSKWVSEDAIAEHPIAMAVEAWIASRGCSGYRFINESVEKSKSWSAPRILRFDSDSN